MTDLTPEEYADKEAGFFFDRATAPQREAYHQRLRDLLPYRGPKAERERAEALRKCRFETAEAAGLFNRTRECVLVTGEVSEALSLEWDEIISRNAALREAAD
jgi:hypothetical protein